MLSWNYWPETDTSWRQRGRESQGQFSVQRDLSRNGPISSPTSNTNSVGFVLGGKAPDAQGDWEDYLNALPNGASHTITFNPSMMKSPEHKDKFKAFLKGYARNGGTALQINMLDSDMLRDAQNHPQNYRHLLVRITGYNATLRRWEENFRTKSSND
jgi:formate C-acetyltransferase